MIAPMVALGGAPPPPLRLPGSHFAVALVFLALGGAGLVAAAPELAAGSYLSPRVTGVTHLFTLGWITTSIMGALYQLLPVALDRGIRWPRVAQGTLAVHAPALLCFVTGLVGQRPGLTVAGATLLTAGILVFIANLSLTLRAAPRRDMTWWALALAAFFLFLTAAVGTALAINLRWPFMGISRIPSLVSHLHLALVGWVLLVMVGVGQRLLPMFLLSHGADERPGRWAVGLLATGAFLVFALHHAPGPWARRIPALFMLLGAAAFLVQARAFYRARKRPSVDPGMRMAAVALALLGAGALLGGTLSVVGFAARPHWATAYVVSLVLGISLFVAAHYYKIVPFLVWMHRFGPVAGKGPVPRVADLYSARWATAAGVLLTLGVVALLAGIAATSPALAVGGAWIFAAGVAVEVTQMAALARTRPS